MKRRSIRERLMVMVIILSTLPVFLSTIVATNNIRDFSEREIVNANIVRVNWGAYYLEELITQFDRLFYSLHINEELIANMNYIKHEDTSVQYETQKYLGDILSMSYYANSKKIDELILYVDQYKTSFMVSYNAIGEVSTIKKLDSYWERLQSANTNIYFEMTDKGIYAVHSLNRFNNKSMYGGLAVKIRENVWQEVAKILEPSNKEEIFIFNDEKEMLLGSRRLPEDIMKTIKESEFSEMSLIKDFNNYYFIKDVDEGKLILVKVVPKSIIKAGEIKTIKAGILITIAFIAIAVMLSIIFALRISKPIMNLANKMRTADLEVLNVSSNQSIDEIDFLEKGYNKMINKLKELIKEEYEHEIQLKNAQLLALQAQINPHFLNNSLNLIGGMALERNAPEIYEVSRSISDLLRYSVTNSNDLVRLKDELDHVSNYLKIQQKRYEGRCLVHLDVEKGVEEILLPKFIIQPIIENAFEYGLQPKCGRWDLFIRVIKTNKKLAIIVKDNGIGINPNKLNDLRTKLENVGQENNDNRHKNLFDGKKGIGMVNVAKRLKLKFGNDSGIRIFSKENVGTMIAIIINIGKEGDENV